MFSAVPTARARISAALTQRGAISIAAKASLSTSAARSMAKESAPQRSSSKVVAEPGSTTFSALEARLNLEFSDSKLMEQVCTHKSYEHGRLPSNERLEWMGKRVLNLYVGEHLHVKYPNLPTETLQDLQHANFGLASLAEVAKHFGMKPAMRWLPSSKEAPNVGLTKVLGKGVQALVGAIYHDQGAVAAKKFIHEHILTKPVDVEAVMQIKHPKRLLIALTKRKNMEFPVARILKETGRFTSSPVFIVGVFSGTKMIGNGFGSSLRMAEHRAAKDALLKYYAKEIKDFELPSVAEEGEEESNITFLPTKVGDTPAYM
ncbi:ribonuclease III [Martensiomyces pterosporus]|nr:ribonuclease III [Martensiomyces pterosporus]